MQDMSSVTGLFHLVCPSGSPMLLHKAEFPFACKKVFIINNPKMHMEPQKTQNYQSNAEKKDKAGGITLSDFKRYLKATIKQSSIGTKTDKRMSGT